MLLLRGPVLDSHQNHNAPNFFLRFDLSRSVCYSIAPPLPPGISVVRFSSSVLRLWLLL